MEVFEIPEAQYAVIVCPNLAGISEAYEALHTRWLPKSGFELDLSHGNFCFELYGMEFMPAEGKETFTIWALVKEVG
jgi:predicted transcriptional regulator YdeE